MSEMNVENVITQMRRGVLELCILSALQRGDAYTTDLVNALKEAEMIVVEGSVYPLLSRLKNQGYLGYRWEDSQQGPPRKYYSLTPQGIAYFDILQKAWYATVETVNTLLASNGETGAKTTEE